jgi:two-component system KDP operon response regulator KdpE
MRAGPAARLRPLGVPAMSRTSPNVLVVDDEEQLLRMLDSTLNAAGYRTTTVKTGQAALNALQSRPYDVIVLDLGLPDIDGKEVISRARAVSQAPIIVLSVRTSEDEKIDALDRGANDFVSKPFSVGELLARLRVAMRPPAPTVHEDHIPGLKFDFKNRTVVVEGVTRRLTMRETEMLRVLNTAKGEVVSHKDLIAGIWGPDSDADVMHLRVLAWQVRRKIEPDASIPKYLLAEPGLGYRLNAGGEEV